MLTLLKDWQGSVEVNGRPYSSISDVYKADLSLKGNFSIKLYPATKKPVNEADNAKKSVDTEEGVEYRIKVKKYMTEKSNPGFDFMAKFNNDNPMPLRIMTGEVIKETRGMVQMKLHGDMYGEKMCTCMKCGRKLTNKISQYFGIGPECGGHNYVNPFDSDEELKQAVEAYKKQLKAITWTGWIIKSAITEMEEVE